MFVNDAQTLTTSLFNSGKLVMAEACQGKLKQHCDQLPKSLIVGTEVLRCMGQTRSNLSKCSRGVVGTTNGTIGYNKGELVRIDLSSGGRNGRSIMRQGNGIPASEEGFLVKRLA
jgi:hypothetical protein